MLICQRMFVFEVQSSVQLLSPVPLFVTPWTAAHQASLSITNSQSLLQLMSIESVTPSKHLILCHPFLLLPSIFSSIMVFPKKSTLRICWPKHWSFSSALVFPMNIQDWFPLGLTGLISLQSKGLSRVFSNTTFQKHRFFAVHHSLWASSHIHTWLLEKNHHFDYMDLVSTVMSLLSNTLSKFVLAFLPRSKCLWLHGCGHHL